MGSKNSHHHHRSHRCSSSRQSATVKNPILAQIPNNWVKPLQIIAYFVGAATLIGLALAIVIIDR